jgi:flavin reductase (DIM6/NTAB) family NADH-FMN oxidoreductase RutF
MVAGSDDTSAAVDQFVLATDSAMLAVTVAVDGAVDGCLVGFHGQCSIDPQRYAVWLSRANHTYRLADRAEYLAVHSLPATATALAAQLGSITLDRNPDKLRFVATDVEPATNAAVLRGADGWFVGRIVGRAVGGDHECFVLEPVRAEAPSTAPRLRHHDVAHLRAGHDA